jgi:hypothetical protein
MRKCKLRFLENSKIIRKKGNLYTLLCKGKKYLVEKKGHCDYKKCNSSCCRFFLYSKSKINTYQRCFGKKTKYGLKINIKCKNLKPDNTCKLWGKSKLPIACKEFPHPIDKMYFAVYGKCGFYFEKVGKT